MLSQDTKRPSPKARVMQVAHLLGESPDSIISQLNKTEGLSSFSWLAPDDVDRLLARYKPRKDPKKLRDQVVAIIDERLGQGQDSIPLSVLKNKLLAATNRDFSEFDYGWPNLNFLPGTYPDLIVLDDSTSHPRARIVRESKDDHTLPNDSGPFQDGSLVGHRIRDDLWNAIVDYKGGNKYVWDSVSNLAIEVEHPTISSSLVFPTITAEMARDWRRECFSDWSELRGEESQAEVKQWIDTPGHRVPRSLAIKWAALQREKVSRILSDFFHAHDIALPKDAFIVVRERSHKTFTARDILVKAVQVMTDSEIESIKLSPELLARALNTVEIQKANYYHGR